jgi:Tfp pilus assembly protein PilX
MSRVSLVTDRIRRRLEDRSDSGQAMVLVLVILVLLASLAPLMAGQVISDTSLLNKATNKSAALAAAEAGIQWYRDNLDTYSDYYTYTSANNPTNDAALSGYCGAGMSSTCDLGGTNPREAFHYAPNASSLFSQTGGAAGTVVLTVTGRAGAVGGYQYVYAQASFSTSSVLQDTYYSNYEVLDPNSATIQGINVSSAPVAGGGATTTPETQFDVSYSYTGAGGTVNVPQPGSSPPSLWQAMCQYATYSPNNFVDSLGLRISGTTYSYAHPYYGPYLENSGFTFDTNGSGQVVGITGGTTKITVPSLPCESPYDFVSGETFNGPVYTNDQLHVCGSPTFNGSPVSLTSGAPSSVPYLYNVPGSVLVTAANEVPNGPYPVALKGDYVPGGYTVDNVNCGGSGDTPNLAHGLALDGTQSLPSLNTALQQYATSNPPSGTVGTGCTYVGPTMIELVYSGGTTTMTVWSPLSSNTAITTSSCSNGKTFSTTTQQTVTGIPLPTDGVVYVQSYTLPSGSPAPSVTDGSTPCFNPYQSAEPASNPQCLEGDVYIEGELHGQLTVASAANVMVTRDLTDACADNGGRASSSNPSSVSGCTTSSTPDILGLSAQQDVLISGNNGGGSSQDCYGNGFGDGTGSPTNTGTMIGGTSYPNDPKAVWPTLCNPQNVDIDAGIFALNGSFGVENWSTTPQSGAANFNGSDLSEYRGPFGIVGSNGYTKQFSFDQRLARAEPPDVLPVGVILWQDDNYVLCPNTSCPAIG